MKSVFQKLYNNQNTLHIEEKKPFILGQIKEIKAEQDKHNQEHSQERGEKKQNISHKKESL